MHTPSHIIIIIIFVKQAEKKSTNYSLKGHNVLDIIQNRCLSFRIQCLTYLKRLKNILLNVFKILLAKP